MDYPKMLYDADGKAVTVESAEGEAEIRKQGYMSLSELSEQRGAFTAPSADQQGTGVEATSIPAVSAHNPDYKAPVAPKVTRLIPKSGSDGDQVAIEGSGFGAQGTHGQVKIGTVNADIATWGDDMVVILAVQGESVFDAPLAVWLRTDAKQDVNAGSFTFTAAKEAAKHDPKYDTKRK